MWPQRIAGKGRYCMWQFFRFKTDKNETLPLSETKPGRDLLCGSDGGIDAQPWLGCIVRKVAIYWGQSSWGNRHIPNSTCRNSKLDLHIRSIVPKSPISRLEVKATSWPNMATATRCPHSFKMIKSESTLMQWHCNLCHSGPHWWIFECKYCKIHTCRVCTQSA